MTVFDFLSKLIVREDSEVVIVLRKINLTGETFSSIELGSIICNKNTKYSDYNYTPEEFFSEFINERQIKYFEIGPDDITLYIA